MPTIDNPLRRHFRQPAIHLRLPSGGKFYPPGALNMPASGELPILPMTAVDEIVTRTPDALFNGSAVPDIIGSCVPSIKDPWAVPSVDINALLVAMRLASYGHSMDLNCTCPGCKTVTELQLDLRVVMDNLGTPDYDTPLMLGDLTLHFAPLSYRQLNENNRQQFEDQKLIQALNSTDMPNEERLKMLGDSFKKITSLTIRAIALSIKSIKTPDAMVVDHSHIEEFLLNCEKGIFEKIKDHAIMLRQSAEIKPLNIECENCQLKFTQEFSLDMANFFETNS
jgi:hypothetical protein